MAYIRRNVNAILLLLVVALVCAAVFLTAKYDINYGNLTEEYNMRVGEINLLSRNLSIRSTELNKTSEELQVRVQDKGKFDLLYSQISAERDSLGSELVQTKGELATTKASLSQSQSDLAVAAEQFNTCSAKNVQLTNRLAQRDSEICALKQQLGLGC